MCIYHLDIEYYIPYLHIFKETDTKIKLDLVFVVNNDVINNDSCDL